MVQQKKRKFSCRNPDDKSMRTGRCPSLFRLPGKVRPFELTGAGVGMKRTGRFFEESTSRTDDLTQDLIVPSFLRPVLLFSRPVIPSSRRPVFWSPPRPVAPSFIHPSSPFSPPHRKGLLPPRPPRWPSIAPSRGSHRKAAIPPSGLPGRIPPRNGTGRTG